MRDLKIKDGDIVKDSSGRLEVISGQDAGFQRAVVSIAANRGKFIYDRNLGCEKNIDFGDENVKDKTELLINEALVNCPNTSARVLEVTSDGIKAEITVNGESREEEISFGG